MLAHRPKTAPIALGDTAFMKGIELIREHYDAERQMLFNEKEELRIQEILKLAALPNKLG